MNHPISIPVSVGELCDKYTILQIKQEKITDTTLLAFVQTEASHLQPMVSSLQLECLPEFAALKKTNELLWDIEDAIRVKERNQEFDAEFICLARLVYKTNDERCLLKSNINRMFHSKLQEVKSYALTS